MDWLIDRSIDRSIDRWIGWLVDWLIDWLIDWLSSHNLVQFVGTDRCSWQAWVQPVVPGPCCMVAVLCTRHLGWHRHPLVASVFGLQTSTSAAGRDRNSTPRQQEPLLKIKEAAHMYPHVSIHGEYSWCQYTNEIHFFCIIQEMSRSSMVGWGTKSWSHQWLLRLLMWQSYPNGLT